jgi:hypothetical protein
MIGIAVDCQHCSTRRSMYAPHAWQLPVGDIINDPDMGVETVEARLRELWNHLRPACGGRQLSHSGTLKADVSGTERR